MSTQPNPAPAPGDSSKQPNPAPAPRGSSNKRLLVGLLLGLALAAAGVGVWLLTRPKQGDGTRPDLVAAAKANARGLFYMTWFDGKPVPGVEKQGYELAAEAFEEASKLATEWTPARVNLGIALLNDRTEKFQVERRARALTVFAEVLAKEPENPHALFCSGIVHHYEARNEKALPFFEAVTRIDPSDPQAWYYRGVCTPDAEQALESKQFYERALKLNPYLNTVRYKLAFHNQVSDEQRVRLINEHTPLANTHAEEMMDIRYTELGRYGDVIGTALLPPPDVGKVPMFEPVKDPAVRLATGTTWAADDKVDELRKAVRSRFGGAVLLLDFNKDGKPDVLLLGAVLRDGKVGDVLLRNEGNNSFSDVTAETDLGKQAGSFGGAVGDFDNDGFPDMILAGPAGLRLYRNLDGKRYEDKTAAAGFDKEPGVYLTANWVDLDLDSDLDLVAAKYAATPEQALKQLQGQQVDGSGGLVAFFNAGMASPSQLAQPVPLTCAFTRVTEPEALLVKGPVTGVLLTDADGDRDTDLIVFLEGRPPVSVLNDRMLRFHRGEAIVPDAGPWNGGLVLDANGDEQPDLVLVSPSGTARLLVSTQDAPGGEFTRRFTPGLVNSPSLRAATWADVDLDGHTDLVGLSEARKPAFLQGDGKGKLIAQPVPFGPTAGAINDALAFLPVDLDGDGNPDVLAWSAAKGLSVFRSAGNGNKGVKLTLSGKWDRTTRPPQRTNTDGIGCWVRLQAGATRTAAENTTMSAGLGQSRLPIHFGIGQADAVELVRLIWPDSAVQAEVNKAAGAVTIVESNRKGTSCPVIFTWNGERFVYVTDMLGAGSMGEMSADGSMRPPRPEESVKIEPGLLVPKNGKYVLKLGEPMDEVMYIDKLRLDVIDHPADVSVFPDERFATSGPQPTQERLFFRDAERVFAAKATDHRGRDVTATLRERDGKHADKFALRSWLGYAEKHFVQLNFDGALKALPAGRRVFLVLAGWSDYAYPESIYAATQAGVPMVPPQLEQLQKDGTWKNLGEIGFPAGLTRVMTKDVTGWIDPAGGPVRIRTNLQIYWDQIYLAPAIEKADAKVAELGVSRGSLEHRGFTQEYSPNGKLPIAYDYDRLEPVAVTRWRGKFTRTGEVTELLGNLDDRHVIAGPGDEITAEFSATELPELPAGWKRSFVLRSWGYCKDSAPTTATAGEVGPVPHRAMPQYPYDAKKYPPPAAVQEYDRKWNTRPAGGR